MTRTPHAAEEKIRIVIEALRGEEITAELCRHEGIAQGLHYKWSKKFLKAGKKRLAGNMAREASRAGRLQRKTPIALLCGVHDNDIYRG